MVEGFGVALESVSTGAAFFLGGMIVGELVGVVVGWVLGDTVDQVLNHDCFYTDTTGCTPHKNRCTSQILTRNAASTRNKA